MWLLSPVFPKDWRNNFLLIYEWEATSGSAFHPALCPSRSRVGTTGYDNKPERGTEIRPKKKKNSPKNQQQQRTKPKKEKERKGRKKKKKGKNSYLQ